MSAVDLARSTIRALLLAGVRDFVLSPGSRNTPLSLELAEAESRGLLRLHVRIDERTAAFLALGLGKGSGLPTAVVSTSGTAAANFHPAVIEASLSLTPMAVVTANRPLFMLGTGANQTIKQVGLYGDAARLAVHVDDQRPETWDATLHSGILAMTTSPAGPGPVQIDLGLTPPLVPDDLDFITPIQDGEEADPLPVAAAAAEIALPERALVVVAECGELLARSAIRSAVAAGYPVHVEAGSALASAGPACLRAGAFLLRSGLVDERRPDHLLIVGRPTLSRPIPALASRPDVAVTVVSDDPSLINPLQTGSPALRASSLTIAGTVDREYAEAWRAADVAAARQIDAETAATFDAGAATAVVAASAPDLLVVASSNPIRDLDERSTRSAQWVVVNRGAAGIDGLVSTSVGAALAAQAADPESSATALLGDLAFLHDTTGLVIGPAEPRPDLTIVVLNNDGGAIFASLEQGAPDYAEHFERVFGTPHGTSIEKLCAATSTTYQRCTTREELRSALGERPAGIRVLEVPISREDERQRRQAFTARVVGAVKATIS
ncbi:2-succinyl-5-enolpyruvyl-6-hydroxy-3-cyclohexene-1-carboxylic-acid synthase [Cumulibacter manganitolerans]|uniref:2-succinyl-5-enolpyruvyl-6-hydroxy-3- cyclohexene-1-carboxylic-acid synthase n=1 Tax=Cumulibacter manganitolerans TaxID=1884992 RepID=UPI001885E91A|nr:2-succinyl-5-enolpyruvyl-6-hydroxy-3-cyclohexene-1-carboxylic-acid synthase [Cumulibacter manganitolerans]